MCQGVWGKPWLSGPALPVKKARGHQPEEAGDSGVPEKGGGTEKSVSRLTPTQVKNSKTDPVPSGPGSGVARHCSLLRKKAHRVLSYG